MGKVVFGIIQNFLDRLIYMEEIILNIAWNLLGQDNCFLCGKSLEEHIEETGKSFDMHCRTGYLHRMEAWNWKTVCSDCLPVLEKIEN